MCGVIVIDVIGIDNADDNDGDSDGNNDAVGAVDLYCDDGDKATVGM